MWFLKWLGFGLLIVVVLVFSLENVGSPLMKEPLALKFIGFKTAELPVFLWLALSFLSGMLLFMAFSLIRELRFRSEIGRLRRELESQPQMAPGQEVEGPDVFEKLL